MKVPQNAIKSRQIVPVPNCVGDLVGYTYRYYIDELFRFDVITEPTETKLRASVAAGRECK